MAEEVDITVEVMAEGDQVEGEADTAVEVMVEEEDIAVEVMAEGADPAVGEAVITDHVTVEEEADEAVAIEEVPDADMVANYLLVGWFIFLLTASNTTEKNL